ncbi:efflux RND transporter permease subunit [Cerasicoccus frondis]|uniref:efflux RND transporter permease subunit n=1 Tax=Cerasicoccus frondis TaxID=490090 RepID=UPI0028529BE4|nr:multidrug efflux RND transporter permease subunit [Cerasicoccus frondis]
MKFSRFFIDRPIFATVLSILTMIVGGLAFFELPVEPYPEVAPPTIRVRATYPGADAETVAATVATPIEQEVNGVEGMLYMSSQSSSTGNMDLTITFELGTDLDTAQVLVQNRVAIAEARLPEAVRSLGVTTQKSSPELMLVINMYSPDGTYDQSYISNYVVLNVRDRIRRIDGVGDIAIYGGSDYAMRVWLDPDMIQSYELTPGEVLDAIREQNVQVASGTLNQLPQPQQQYYEYTLQTQGRLIDPESFGEIVVKSDDDGRLVRLRDVADIQLGAQEYTTLGYLNSYPAVAVPVYQRPGTNALATANAILAEIEDISNSFPPGLQYEVAYNPTKFIEESVNAVEHTVIEAVVLVVLVMFVFLQSWRVAIIPIVAIPVSLIGTFAVMAALGFSLNTLTLFGLVLAIGIVVDDAIVVVENMERNMREGMKSLQAARKTMDEVGSALVGMGLVLVAVFLPTTFMEGMSGKFYQAFGVTIAVATMISVLVSLTLSPALAAILMKEHEHDPKPRNFLSRGFHFCCDKFNAGMDGLSNFYGRIVGGVIRWPILMLFIYALLMVGTITLFNRTPTGFIPAQDKGYLIVSIELPSGASLSETDRVTQRIRDKIMAIDGIADIIGFSGYSAARGARLSNGAALFPVLEGFDERETKGLTQQKIMDTVREELATIKDATAVVFAPPPVRGIGSASGFRMMVQDRSGRGTEALKQAVFAMEAAGNDSSSEATTAVNTFFNNNTPQIYLDVDRVRAEQLSVPVSRIFEALEVYVGSVFVNDLSYLGRTFRVTAQAKPSQRLDVEDVMQIKVRSDNGSMVPLGSIATVQNTTGPTLIPRYNLYPAAPLRGSAAPGYSSGEALDAMEQIAATTLPEGFDFEWTELAYQERLTGNTAIIAFILAVVFVFLLLSALYESWMLPLSIILIVPMCLFSAISGVSIAGMDNNILTQIGFVVLIGLASKNAILIVEFARELESQGRDRWAAATEAARLRLRPILMTSFAFILGVVPLVLAKGAGAEMRQALGVAVFSGMLGVTFFGLFFTPVFYVICRRLSVIRLKQREPELLPQTANV